MAERPHTSPSSRDAQHRRARALVEQGQPREAVAAYEAFLAAHPDHAPAWFELAGVLDQHLRRPDLALAQLMRGLESAPHDAARFCNSIGVFHKKKGDRAAALSWFERAVAADPKLPDAHANLGMIHYERGATAPAVEHYGRAVELAPHSPKLLHNYALVLSKAGRGEDAVRAGRRSVELDPANATAWHHLGLTLRKCGRLDEALSALRKSVSVPGHSAVFYSDLLMLSLYDSKASMTQLVESHRAWARCHAPKPAFTFAPRPSGRRLKIGYVSGDFCMHPVGHFLAPVLPAHDRGRFEVFAYSSTRKEDELTRHLAAHCDHFVHVESLDDEQLAQRIHQDGIDVAVDLSGHTAHNRLITFALKPAPVQLSWLGYPFTTGLSTIDYVVTDRFETPDGWDTWFTEKLLRMPNGYLCVRPPPYELPVAPLPAVTEPVFTFGCFNNLSKVTPDVIALWSDVVKATQPSRLYLHTRELDDPATRADVRARFERHGVSGDRLWLEGGAPHAELLSHYGRVDLALDPFPYCGGLTTCEAMWMGVPTVTWPSERFCGRHSLTHQNNVGLPEFTADSKASYVEIASAWRKDVAGLASLRASLRQRMQDSPLVDGVRFTRDFERELTRIVAESGL